jgi:hypothetical protein
VFAITGAYTVNTFYLNPLNLDQRLIEQSDEFQEYRFTSVRLTAFSPIRTDTAMPVIQVAYTPVVLGTTPTYAQMTSLAVFGVGSGSPGSPYPSIRPARSELQANPPRWFRRGTAFDDLLESQGIFYVGSDVSFATRTVYVHFQYTVELKARAEAALTALISRSTPQDSMAMALNMVPNPNKTYATLDSEQNDIKTESAGTAKATVGLGVQRGTLLGQTGEAGGSQEPPVDVAEEATDGVWVRLPVDTKCYSNPVTVAPTRRP